MATSDRQPFSLRLPPDLANALRKQAAAHERSAGAEVRTIFRRHLVHERTVRVFTDEIDFSEGDQS